MSIKCQTINIWVVVTSRIGHFFSYQKILRSSFKKGSEAAEGAVTQKEEKVKGKLMTSGNEEQ